MVNEIAKRDSSMRRALPFLVLLLFVLPVAVYWVYFHWGNRISPYFERYDPEFAYFMNSLEVFKGHPYAYMDHPGTPVEVIGTLILALLYPFLHLSPGDFVLYNLRHPGLFLYLGHAFLLLASIGCVVFFFKTAAHTQGIEDVLVASALSTSYFVLHPAALLGTSTWSHNTFAFPFGTLLLLFVYRYLRREPLAGDRRGTLVALGLGTGIFAAITVLFAAWAGGTALVLAISRRLQGYPWRKILLSIGTYLLASLMGFVLAVLPAANNAGYFFDFLHRMLTRENRPGQGLVVQNLISFGQRYPVLAVSTVALLILLVIAWARQRREASKRAASWGLAAGLSVQLVVVLGAILLGRFGNQFYFLALAAIVPVLALAVLEIYGSHVALRWIIIFLVVVGLPLSLRSEMLSHDRFATYINGIVHEQTLGIQRYKDQAPASADPVIVYSFGTYSACGSLWHGNSFASEVLTEDVARICRNEYFYFRYPVHFDQENEAPTYRVRTPQGPLPAGQVTWDIFVGCQKMLSSPLLKGNTASSYRTTRWIGVCPTGDSQPLIIAYRR